MRDWRGVHALSAEGGARRSPGLIGAMHYWKKPVRSPSEWRGAVLAAMVLAMSAYLLVKGGCIVLVPFALALALVMGLLLYLKWLLRAGS